MYSITLSPASIVLCGVVVAAAYFLYRLALPKPIPGIPYHKHSATRLLGDIPELGKHIKETGAVFDFFSEQCEKLKSPIVQLFIRPGGSPKVIVTDFRECQDILMRRFSEFDRSDTFTEILGGTIPNHSILMRTTEKYKKQSRLLGDTMGPRFLNNVAGTHLYRSAQQLVELWSIKANLAKGHPFEAGEDINHMALDAIWKVAFGSDIDTIKTQTESLSKLARVDLPNSVDHAVEFPRPALPPRFYAIIHITDAVTKAGTSAVPAIRHWFTRQNWSYKKSKAHTDQMIEESIQESGQRFQDGGESETDHINSAVDVMVQQEHKFAEKENRPMQLYTPEYKDELFGFLIAGHDTTSGVMRWGVKYLADNPSAQSSLRQEICTNLATTPDLASITKANLPYLDAVIEETLRCAQTAQGLIRITKTEVEVLGHIIPAGIDVYCLGNHLGVVTPETYAQPDEKMRSKSSREAKDRTGTWARDDMSAFCPERWLKTAEDGGVEFDARAGPSLPFGAGPRGCFGRKLAYLELRIVFILLVSRFEFLGCGPECSSPRGEQHLVYFPKQCFVRLREL